MQRSRVMAIALLAFVAGILTAAAIGHVEAQPRPEKAEAAAKGWKGGLWVEDNIDSGTYMYLSDDSIWETNSLDRLNVSLWLSTDKVAVVDGERLVPEKKSARATKLKPNDLKARKGDRAGTSISSRSLGGRIIELADGTLWEVNSTARIKTALWMTLDKVTVRDDVKLCNTSRDPAETVGAVRLK